MLFNSGGGVDPPPPRRFVPEKSFHLLVKRQIHRLELPSLETVEAIRREMQKICVTIAAHSALTRFPYLHDQVVDTVNQLLSAAVKEAHFMVTSTERPGGIQPSRTIMRFTETLMKRDTPQKSTRREAAPFQRFPTE